MSNALRTTLIIFFVFILILITAVFIAGFIFNRGGDKKALDVLSTANIDQRQIIKQSDLAGLPPCVQQWMKRSGVIGKEKIHTVRLVQTGRMRNEQGKPWMPLEAVQYINVDKPGFVWKAKVKAAPIVNLLGRDMYYQGHGSMVIKLLSLLPVVNTKSGMEIDQSTMVRFMAEMIWYPSAALNDYIKWEGIDSHSARATMTWQGVKASMIFYFNDQGDMVSNVAPRYQEVNGNYVLHDWGGIAREYRKFNGIRVPNKSDVVWKYKTGDFNWLQIEVTKIDFNQPGLY